MTSRGDHRHSTYYFLLPPSAVSVIISHYLSLKRRWSSSSSVCPARRAAEWPPRGGTSGSASVVQLARPFVFLDRVAAVDHHELPGDVAGVVGAEEADELAHLGRRRGAPEGRVLSAGALALGGRARVDPARAHGVDGDPVLRHVERQPAGHAEHPGLGGAVHRFLRIGDHRPGDRRHIDDAAVAPVDHPADDSARHVELGLQVDGDAEVPVLLAHVGEIGEVLIHALDDHAGVVHEHVNAAVAEAVTCHGRIDVLVNNAGMVIEGMDEDFTDFAHMSEKDWDFGIAINLKTQFNVTRTVIGGMIERGYGRIVNVSSVTGPVVANPEESVYCAAKAGVLGMTRGLALDVAKHGITVNAVGPGWINTGSTTEGRVLGAGRGRQAHL